MFLFKQKCILMNYFQNFDKQKRGKTIDIKFKKEVRLHKIFRIFFLDFVGLITILWMFSKVFIETDLIIISILTSTCRHRRAIILPAVSCAPCRSWAIHYLILVTVKVDCLVVIMFLDLVTHALFFLGST